MINYIIKRILTIFSIIFILLTNTVGAYYCYENRFPIFKLNRNNIPANCIISYDKETITNKDVEVKINFDKIISVIGDNKGMELSEDRKSLSKVLSTNENNKLLVRDEDFNYQEVEYNVNWIDKQPPIITGAENGQTYDRNVHLDYTDNCQIAEIYADYYSDEFSIYIDEQDFYETDNMQIIPANKESITAYVLSNTKEMEQYRYYLDGELCATTHDKKYTFTNLSLSDENHHIVVEALDRYGNVLDEKETFQKTRPFSRIEFNYNNSIKYIALKGTPENLTKITALAWVWGHEDSYCTLVPTHDGPNSYVVSLAMGRHKNYSGRYYVKIEMEYNEGGDTKQSTIIGSVDMPNKYKPANYKELPNDFMENGKYYVRCTDEAGNETEIDFVVQK